VRIEEADDGRSIQLISASGHDVTAAVEVDAVLG